MNQPPSTNSPPAAYFCTACGKPFSSESSRTRHIRYCGSRVRSRPRSCQACSAAKTKCSFEVPCLRCSKKGLECTYHEAAARASHPLAVVQVTRTGPRDGMADTMETEPPSVANNDLFKKVANFTDAPSLNSSTNRSGSGNSYSSTSLSLPGASLNDCVTMDGILAFGNDQSFDRHLFSAAVSAVMQDSLRGRPEKWCKWTLHGVSLAAMAENAIIWPGVNSLIPFQIEHLDAHYNANIIVQALRSVPTMMLRRETFPWFIHSPSQPSSTSTRPALPKALCNCISIAQIFALRTVETRHFLRDAIRDENRRLLKEKYSMSKSELLTTVQYEEHDRELLVGLHEITNLLKGMHEGRTCESEALCPSSSWEGWIFAESRRRLANLWFLIGCVVSVKTGNCYDASLSFRDLPLPGPKAVWEASTEGAWEIQYQESRTWQLIGLITLGDLLDIQQLDYSSANARRLDQWNAGTDNLGSLLNLVGSML